MNTNIAGIIMQESTTKEYLFNEILESKKLSDTFIEQQFLKYYNKNILFVRDTKNFFVFNGKFYKEDSGGLLVAGKIKEFIQAILNYAVKESITNNVVKSLFNYLNEPKIRSIVVGLKTEALIEFDQINTNEFLFNCQNGILDLSGNEPKLIPHSEKYLITQLADVEYHPELGEVNGEAKDILLSFFQSDEGILNFLFEFLGVSLTGYAAIRKFVYAFGSGRNGKSTLFDFFLKYFFGNYGTSANFQTFTMDRNHNGATSDIVRIMNKRFVITNEAKAGIQLNTNLIKTITGGDNFQARLNFKDEGSFTPRCKIIMFGNNQLSIDDSSSGMQDRFVQMPFLVKFKGDVSQNSIWKVLRDNKPQILNSLIAGYYSWKHSGNFNIPESVKAESLKGFTSANSYVRFLNESLIKEQDSKVKLKEVWERYKKFAVDEELSKRDTLSRAKFKNALRSSDIKIFPSSKGTEYVENYILKDENLDENPV